MHIHAPHVDNTDETGLTPQVVAGFIKITRLFEDMMPDVTSQPPKHLSLLKFPREQRHNAPTAH